MRGEWIEISSSVASVICWSRLSPCGESGLKCCVDGRFRLFEVSLPMRGEWIEMFMAMVWSRIKSVSPHAGRVD